MRQRAPPPRNPRPVAALFILLAASAVVLGLFLLYDGRAIELKRARAEIHQLDRQIADRRRENGNLRASITAASRGELPAEKAAREELHLVHPEDFALLSPNAAPSPQKPPPASSPVATPSPPGRGKG